MTQDVTGLPAVPAAEGPSPGTGSIITVETDLVHVSQIRWSLERFGDRFLHRIFTEREREECYLAADPAPRLAARYAAKEATIKALRVGSMQPTWNSMEIWRPPAGWCDEVRLSGQALDLAALRRIGHLWVSLSHGDDEAVAVVVATKAVERFRP